MSFKLKLFNSCFAIASANILLIATVNAVEWKTEPTISMDMQYNDNVRMRVDNDNPEGSTGFIFEPRVKLAGIEQHVWDVSIDALGRIIRFQDIEDSDSENVFFVFNGGRQTERTDWRLNTSFERNSNFDTDFDFQNPDAGLLDDHTERKTKSISPSVSWSISETSQMSFSLNSTAVSYDEVTNLNLTDYDYDSAQFVASWQITENQRLGFTSSYAEYESPETNFSYDQVVFQVDYSFALNQLSKVSLSVGGRRLDSLRTDVTTGCEVFGEIAPIEDFPGGICPTSPFFVITPVVEDIVTEEDGTVVNVSYNSNSERVNQYFAAGRTVSPSSFGGAQEVLNATYRFKINNTERFSTNILLNASETETISGINSSNDRTRYRVEPSVVYRLSKNWNLSFIYRYIDQTISSSDEESTSNAVFINLFLHWPKLATTY